MNPKRQGIWKLYSLGWAAVLGAMSLVLLPLVGASPADAQGDGQPATAPAESSPADGASRTAGAWGINYDAALAEAAEKKLPVLLRFTASWCPPCQVMDARVFPDARVQSAITQHAIPVMIDVDREESAGVARRYGVRGIPTLIRVDASGRELARGGFMSAEQLVEFLRR